MSFIGVETLNNKTFRSIKDVKHFMQSIVKLNNKTVDYRSLKIYFTPKDFRGSEFFLTFAVYHNVFQFPSFKHSRDCLQSGKKKRLYFHPSFARFSMTQKSVQNFLRHFLRLMQNMTGKMLISYLCRFTTMSSLVS